MKIITCFSPLLSLHIIVVHYEDLALGEELVLEPGQVLFQLKLVLYLLLDIELVLEISVCLVIPRELIIQIPRARLCLLLKL